jgi:hypothetical protein
MKHEMNKINYCFEPPMPENPKYSAVTEIGSGYLLTPTRFFA